MASNNEAADAGPVSRFLRTRNRGVDGLDEREWKGPFDFVVMADTQFGMPVTTICNITLLFRRRAAMLFP